MFDLCIYVVLPHDQLKVRDIFVHVFILFVSHRKITLLFGLFSVENSIDSASEEVFLKKKNLIIESTLPRLDILFSSNHNTHKSSCGLLFWPSDPFIENF